MKAIHGSLLVITLLLGGCMTTENTNLQKPFGDPTKAEIAGSKLKGRGPMPDRVWAVAVDGTKTKGHRYPWDAIFTLEPGVKKVSIQYDGMAPQFMGLPRGFSAQIELSLEASAGVRYITRGKYSESQVTVWIEEFHSGRVVTPEKTAAVSWIQVEVY